VFSFKPPSGWDITEGEFAVSVTDPESGISFYVGAINAGIQLDAQSFENFVIATDSFYYASAENYKQVSYTADSAQNLFEIENTYTSEAKTNYADSIYFLDGQALYIIEIIGSNELIQDDNRFRDIYNTFYETIELSSDVTLSIPIYQPSWTFVGPNRTMSISVPIGWTYLLDDRQTYTDSVIETLTSPDSNALIENISVVDGNSYTMGNAGQIALFLLNDRYSSGGTDIRVSDTKILGDGSEFWTWTSTKGGYSGTTNFELRDGGKQILLLSFVSSNATVDVYFPLFDRVLASYAIP
jgi:hypothetical protein